MTTLGERLKILRGKTPQAQFAAMIGVNANTLRAYEHDRHSPNAEVLANVCIKLDVDARWLLLGEDGTGRQGAPMNLEEIMAEVMSRPHYYVLNEDHTVRPAKDVIEWVLGLAWSGRRVVVATSYIRGVRVDTRFLGNDMNFGPGPALLFETLVLDGPLAPTAYRAATWEQAEECHQEAVRYVLAVLAVSPKVPLAGTS